MNSGTLKRNKKIFKKILFIFFEGENMHKREQEQWGGAGGEGETDSLLSTEPDSGLDPRTLGS